MAAKRTKVSVAKLDKAFSDCVRERADFNCENCGDNYRQQPGMMDCSHHISRGCRILRWRPENACAHCKPCHKRFTHDTDGHVKWKKEFLGDLYDTLYDMRHQLTHWRDADKKEFYDHYRAELKRMKKLRDQGVTGRIEFTAPPSML